MPDDSFDELLLQATCSISVDGALRGTGWLVDHLGHIVTAAHVLGKEKPDDSVQVAFLDDEHPTQAAIAHWRYDPDRGVDSAVLAIVPSPTRKPLPLSLSRNPSGTVKVYGFGKTLVDLSPGNGVAIGPFHPSNRVANRLFALESHQTREQGYSGAAIYSESLGGVVGIQIEGTVVPGSAPHGTTVLAMPLYRIAEEFPALEVLSDLKAKASTTGYWFHAYLSYDRGGIQEQWVDQHFKEELSRWLTVELGVDSSVFSNHNPKRNIWDKDFQEAILRSYCLVPVLTPSYWRSLECLAEFRSFQERERKEKVAVTYGVLFHEGGAVPKGVKLDVEDFHEHANVYDGFRTSARYGPFQDRVKEFTKRLSGLIRNAPECEGGWPILSPKEVDKPVGARELRIERPTL